MILDLNFNNRKLWILKKCWIWRYYYNNIKQIPKMKDSVFLKQHNCIKGSDKKKILENKKFAWRAKVSYQSECRTKKYNQGNKWRGREGIQVEKEYVIFKDRCVTSIFISFGGDNMRGRTHLRSGTVRFVSCIVGISKISYLCLSKKIRPKNLGNYCTFFR